MVAAQDAHLRAASAAGGLDGLAGAIEHAHVGHRAGGARVRALHVGTLGTDRGEVVADAAAPAHRLGGLLERGVDAGLAVDDLRDRVADRLYEAVDERRRHGDTGGGVDATGGDEARLHRLGEAPLPVGALLRGFGRGEGAGHALAHLGHGALFSLGVFLEQGLAADILLGESFGDGGDGLVHGAWKAAGPVIIYSKRAGWRWLFGRSSMRLIRQAL